MKPYLWQLPSFNEGRGRNKLIYSKYYGLLSVGGTKAGTATDEILQLQLNNIDDISYNDWNWKCIAKMEQKLKNVNCCMINDRTMFVCGGVKSTNSDSKEVKIYDFEICEWIPLRQSKYARSDCGILFDKFDKKIYCVGGNESSFGINKCEYYDLEQNQWFRLPNTTQKHGNKPLLYKHPNNKNILIIASCITNCIETYDLRSATAVQYTRNFNFGWNCIYGQQDQYPMYQKSLAEMFDVKFNHNAYRNAKCSDRLLRFIDDYF